MLLLSLSILCTHTHVVNCSLNRQLFLSICIGRFSGRGGWVGAKPSQFNERISIMLFVAPRYAPL